MRIVGYCDVCRRVRYVRIIRLQPRGISHGICADCERKEEEKRRELRES
jgi:hypothetical protein